MSSEDKTEIERLIAPFAAREGGLLPALHEVQHHFGHIPRTALEALASAFNISLADVHGVVSFYADFTEAPVARHRLQLCMAEACQARGVAETCQRLEKASGLRLGEARADGSLSLEAIYCLGLCATGPAALVDGAPRARLSGSRLDALIAETVR